MNRLLLSAAACAMLTPFAACARETPQTEAAKTEETAQTTQVAMAGPEKADKKMEAAEANYDASGVILMPAASLSAKELIGGEIKGADGKKIATIDDIVIDENGRADDIVFKAGDFLGVGGKRGALDYRAVDIDVNRDNEPVVKLSMTEDDVKAVAEYKTTKMNDYSLASELLGAQADLKPDGAVTEDIVVNDIIFNPDGDVEYLIVQKSAVGPIGAGDKYAVAFNALKVEQGDGGLILDMTESELDQAPKFKMSDNDLGDAYDKTKHDVKDAVDDAGDKIEDAVD